MSKEIIDLLEKAKRQLGCTLDKQHYTAYTKHIDQALTLLLLKQQPTASEFTKEIRTKLGNDPDPTTAYHWERLDKYWLCRNMFKLCAIIDRAESINKDLLDALNSWVKIFECHKGYEGLVENSKAAMAKEKI